MTDTPNTDAASGAMDDVIEIIETVTEDNALLLLAMIAAGAVIGIGFAWWYLTMRANISEPSEGLDNG